MIVVKTQETLRVRSNGRKILIQIGSVFKGGTIEDLPEWLQEHIPYFKKTGGCTTLIINETAEIVQPIASKGNEIDEKDVVNDIDTKEVEEVEEPKKEVVVKLKKLKKSKITKTPLKKRTVKK